MTLEAALVVAGLAIGYYWVKEKYDWESWLALVGVVLTATELTRRFLGRRSRQHHEKPTRVGEPSYNNQLDVAKGKIHTPKKNTSVGRTIYCRGSASRLGHDVSLWLFVEVGQQLWPKEGALEMTRKGRWKHKVFQDGPHSSIALSLFAANPDAHMRIIKWLEEGRKKGKYAPIVDLSHMRRLDRVVALSVVPT